MLAGIVPVTRLRRAAPTGQDQYGEPTPGGWERAPLPPALYAPAESTEPTQPGARPVITSASVYWRGQRPDVTAEDRLLLDGIEHRIIGRPAAWPTGLHAQVEAIEPRTRE